MCVTIINSTFVESFLCAMPCADSFIFVLLFDIDNKPSSRYYCSNFIDKEAEIHQGDITDLRPHW